MELLSIAIVVAAILAAAGFSAAIAFRRVVPTNMVHIVQSSKSTTAYGKDKPAGNSYFEWPSQLPFIGVSVTTFPESIFQVSLDGYEAYDASRLPFVVDVTAFFKVDDANKVAQRVSSFNELSSQLHQVIQGSVRRILSTNKLEEIMESRSHLSEQFTQEVGKDIKEWGVFPVKNIEFMDIRDSSNSKVIANIMSKEQSRIDMESRQRVAENKKMAELAEIDAKRTVDVQQQDAQEQVGIRSAEKDKAVGIASEKASQEIKEQAKVTAEKEMEVLKVNTVKNAEITREASIVKAEQDKAVAALKAEQDKTVAETKAEADKRATTLLAEGRLAESQNEAQGIKLKGDASAAAEKAMLMAPVEAQIALANEIGANEGYQQYLITIKQIETGKEVGIEMAKAMQGADLKVISNAGDPQSGIAKIGDLFTTGGGTNLSGMLAALSQTDEGKALLGGLTARLAGKAVEA